MEKEKALKQVVAERIEIFKKKPEAAIYKPRVSSRHVSGLYTETRVREHTVKSDYGVAAGGTNMAPNPVELLMTALAACIEAAFYEFAELEGITVQSLAVDVEGTLDLRGFFMVDESVAPGFQQLKFVFTIETSEADETRVRDLAERVVAHCPVVESLKRPIALTGDIRIKKP